MNAFFRFFGYTDAAEYFNRMLLAFSVIFLGAIAVTVLVMWFLLTL